MIARAEYGFHDNIRNSVFTFLIRRSPILFYQQTVIWMRIVHCRKVMFRVQFERKDVSFRKGTSSREEHWMTLMTERHIGI